MEREAVTYKDLVMTIGEVAVPVISLEIQEGMNQHGLLSLTAVAEQVILMIWGGYNQIGRLKDQGIPLNTPLIGFEVPRADNGKIYTSKETIDTTK